ncbi:MAG: pyridoxine 5'-phosphate synthase [Cyclobacteriaceae bacterium]
MTRLSVNINKVATLRNARGGNNPNVVQVANECEHFGAEGITVHPRPDERHIRYQDVLDLKDIVTTEFNIEGYPDERFMKLVERVRPNQATLVPDPPDVLTSNAGWDTVSHQDMLKDIIGQLKKWGIRTSVFISTDLKLIEGAANSGTDRVELYTEPYAADYHKDREQAVMPFVKAAEHARKLGLGLNAGHDLDLQNLNFLQQRIPFLEEVSIGHALIADALYYGLENTVQMYKEKLRN